MCGRYVTPSEAEIEALWHIGRHNWRSPFEPGRGARYNVAPQQGNPKHHIPVIRAAAEGELKLSYMQWWLLPFWSKEVRIKYSTFNARVENVATSASFRTPFQRRRCLIPARGWYEWQATPGGKQPWYLHAADGGLLAFAGLWDRWQHGEQVIESCTIIVGEANATVRPIHDRMPFAIPLERQAAWLAPGLSDAGEIRRLLEPIAAGALSCHRVDSRVGNTANDQPSLIEPAAKPLFE